MSKQNPNERASPGPKPGLPRIYEIRVEGLLGQQWTDRFNGLTITPLDNGCSLLAGSIPDQAALFGYLKKIRDLGIPLISVHRIESRRPVSVRAAEKDVSTSKCRRSKKEDKSHASHDEQNLRGRLRAL